MRGLIIDEPWVSLILAGKKTWEMRKSACRVRGQVALIRKGSGQVVGVADIVGSFPALETTEAYTRAEPFHGISVDRQVRAFADGWRTPWVLAKARALSSPVAYRHPLGAVIWVNLDPNVAAAVEAHDDHKPTQEVDLATPDQMKIHSSERARETSYNRGSGNEMTARKTIAAKRKRIQGRIEGDRCIIPVSQGNITNSHVYLRSVLSFFPTDCVGGSDATQSACHSLTVSFDGGTPLSTDIAGPDVQGRKGRSAHYFFRDARSSVLRMFFERNHAEAGDEIVIRRDSLYAYSVGLRKPVGV
jgi:hypothetical protein